LISSYLNFLKIYQQIHSIIGSKSNKISLTDLGEKKITHQELNCWSAAGSRERRGAGALRGHGAGRRAASRAVARCWSRRVGVSRVPACGVPSCLRRASAREAPRRQAGRRQRQCASAARGLGPGGTAAHRLRLRDSGTRRYGPTGAAARGRPILRLRCGTQDAGYRRTLRLRREKPRKRMGQVSMG
jgi:hypothetical protein